MSCLIYEPRNKHENQVEELDHPLLDPKYSLFSTFSPQDPAFQRHLRFFYPSLKISHQQDFPPIGTFVDSGSFKTDYWSSSTSFVIVRREEDLPTTGTQPSCSSLAEQPLFRKKIFACPLQVSVKFATLGTLVAALGTVAEPCWRIFPTSWHANLL